MEELLLLALDDEKGKIISSSSCALPYGLRGALLLELVLAEKIDVVDKKIVVINKNNTGNEVVDNALNIIDTYHKQKTVKFWITKLTSKMKELRKDLLNQLITKGILEQQDKKVLWVIPATRYPTKNPVIENRVRKRIIGIVLHNEKLDERSSMLISLINACELIKEVFPKDNIKDAKKKIKNIIQDEKVGKAITSQISDEIMLTIMVLMVTTTVTSN
jgi:hypothetical protein